MTARSGLPTATVVLLYVVPLSLTVAFLASVGLVALAIALVAVELVVVTAVALARRGPRRPPRPAPVRSGTAVLLAAGAAVLVVVGVLALVTG